MKPEASPAREAALDVLRRYRRAGAWSQQAISAAAVRFSLDRRDAALCAGLCYSVLRNTLLCDHYIRCFSERPDPEIEPQIRDILRLGICQILFMDRIPDRAAADEAVEQAKRARPKAAPFVNAVLRRICSEKDRLPPIPDPDTPRGLSVRYSHPLWICEKLAEEYGIERTRAFLETNNREPMLTVTVNGCRTNVSELCRVFRDNGIRAAVNPVSDVSVDIPGARGDVRSLPGFSEGAFFVQDAAAARSVLSASPRPGESVLDVCAAPGGKSLLCAILMKNQGSVLSCDIHGKKISLIEENRDRLGLDIITTRTADASVPDGELYELFDLVIADVPCSGFGVIRGKPEIRYKPWKSVAGLPAIQQKILENVSRYVRPGGRLLYSTCTVFREENDDVVEAFLSAHPEYKAGTSELIWPQDHDTDGFYYCCMERIDPNA